jgi:hypothetical protein
VSNERLQTLAAAALILLGLYLSNLGSELAAAGVAKLFEPPEPDVIIFAAAPDPDTEEDELP